MTKLLCDRCGGDQDVKPCPSARLEVPSITFIDGGGVKYSISAVIQAEQKLGDLCKRCRLAILEVAKRVL